MNCVWSIQYLRALAALGVVVFHALESTPYKFHIGQAGVDVFFVVSGFIMTILMLGREDDPRLFLWRRLVRIAPLYWAVTFAALAVSWIKPNFFYRFDGSLENTLLSLLFVPHASADGVAPVLWQGWTLEYEMFFYGLCALCLLAPAGRRLMLLGAALGALTLAGAALPVGGPAGAVYTNPLLLEFAAGVALATAWRRGLMARPLLGAAALIAGLGAFVAHHFGILPVSGLRALDWGLPALLTVAGAVSLEAAGRVPRSRASLLLGDASYSLYLTHGFVVSALVWTAPAAPVWLKASAAAVLSAAAAIACYLVFERPTTQALKRLGERLNIAPRPRAGAAGS